MDQILYEVADKVAVITLNRPEAANAQTGALLEWSELETLPGILGGGSTDWRLWQRNCLQRARHFDRDMLVDDLVMRLEQLVTGTSPPERLEAVR